MQTPNKFALTAIAIVVSTFSATAQTNNEPGLFAEAKTTIAHDDNIFRVTDELAQSDSYLRVAPELMAVGGIGKHRFSLSYTGDYAKFSDADDADFNDHDLRARIDLEHSLRFSTKFEAGLRKDHEDPGTLNRIQLNITEYNKYDQEFFSAGFAYGSTQATGRLSFDYTKTDNDYTTNDLDYLDYVSDQLKSRFAYKIAPNTRLYAEVIISEFDYDAGIDFELDNRYKRYRAGITWDFTGKLKGDVNLGYQDRNYELDTLRDIDGLAYDADITWSVNTFTKLTAIAKRESIDSSLPNSEDAGGFLRTSYGVRFSHELNELWRITANVGVADDELVFNSFREDKRSSYKAGMEYDLIRQVTLAVEYNYETRDSSQSIADYKANILSLSVTVSLEN